MNAHAVQRARERLGVRLTANEERAVLADIQSGRLAPVPAQGDRRAWYETTVCGVPAWVLYDCGARSIVTVLDRRPYELGQPLPALYAFADEYGVSHAEAKRIAGREYEHLRHAHKSDRLTGMQAQKLRPLFEAAGKKSEETPMEKPEGYALSLIVQKTGVPEGTIKSLVSRHPELQDMPYSTKAAGARVFFDPFVVWLAEHQGEGVAKVARATSATKLPAGIQLHELRMIYGPKEAARRLDYVLGYAPPPVCIEGPASHEIAIQGFAGLEAVAAGLSPASINKATRAAAAVTQAVLRREAVAARADAKQGKLGI